MPDKRDPQLKAPSFAKRIVVLDGTVGALQLGVLLLCRMRLARCVRYQEHICTTLPRLVEDGWNLLELDSDC